MTARIRILSRLAGVALALAAGGTVLADATGAAAPTTYAATSGSGQVVISGTSTLHDWTVKGQVIQGQMVFTAPLKGDAAPKPSIQSIDLTIPVTSLKSTEGSGMDNTMYDALKLKQYPTITYKMTAVSLKSTPTARDPAWHFGANGELTVAGKPHLIYLDLAATPRGEGGLSVSTNVGLKMTDYGISPPTALLGAVKSGDGITVNVIWQLAPKPAEAAK